MTHLWSSGKCCAWPADERLKLSKKKVKELNVIVSQCCSWLPLHVLKIVLIFASSVGVWDACLHFALSERWLTIGTFMSRAPKAGWGQGCMTCWLHRVSYYLILRPVPTCEYVEFISTFCSMREKSAQLVCSGSRFSDQLSFKKCTETWLSSGLRLFCLWSLSGCISITTWEMTRRGKRKY